MTGSSLGVAVTGYGWMGRLHAQAYLRLRHHYPQRDGGPSPVPGSAARAPVAIGLAAWRSVREGRPVRLAEIA